MDGRDMGAELGDVIAWAEVAGEGKDTLSALRRIPLRLGDAAPVPIPACLTTIEAALAGRVDAYAEVSRSRDLEGARRREDSRIRAVMGRYAARDAEFDPAREEARAAWAALRDRMGRAGGEPGTTGPFDRWSHRTLAPLVARARAAPLVVDQGEVDRLAVEMGSAGRNSLAGAVATVNDISARRDELGLVDLVPDVRLAVPAAEARAPRVCWDRLPAVFRVSAEAMIDRAARPTEVAEDDLLARLDAGEDVDALLAEADAIAAAASSGSRNVAEFVVNARAVLAWLVRARETHCGLGRGTLTSPSDLLGDAVLRAAIADHLAAAAAGQVKRVGHASTLSGRLTLLGTLVARGLGDPKLAARIALLAKVKVAVQAERDRNAGDELMVADEIAARMRAAPGLGVAYVNAPARLSTIAEARIEAAQLSGSTTRLLGAYKLHRGAAMAAIFMSRPVRGHHLHEALIRPTGHLAGNLERLPGGALRLSWRTAGSKNSHAYAVTLRGGDADILRAWLDVHRAAYMKAAGIDVSPYLFPGTATPKRSSHGTPMPRGTRSRESIRADWHAASSCLGYPTTPHNARHIVAILILARYPGDFARVASVLGITEKMAQERYGRDNGERASEQVRAALLAEHGDALGLLGRRLAR